MSYCSPHIVPTYESNTHVFGKTRLSLVIRPVPNTITRGRRFIYFTLVKPTSEPYINCMEKNLKNAVIDLEGARCASCAYTIEHLGRKIQGIHHIHVDALKGEIHVDYEGNPESLKSVTEIVHRIGYNAVIR